ncbi:MAG TPA: hypothetical protein VGD17_19635 [Chitinophagaceae bacterium]
MKKIFLMLLSGIAMISMTSCVTSLERLVTPDKITTDPRITGNWLNDGEEFKIVPMQQSELVKDLTRFLGKSTFMTTGDDEKDSIFLSKTYIVSYERNDVQYHMIAGLMKTGNNVFLDLFPVAMNDPKASESNPYGFNNDYLSGYTIAKLEMKSNSSLTLKFIDASFITENIKNGKMRVKHEMNELFGTFMITASSTDLQKFVQKYGNDERIFSKESSVTLTRKPTHL